MAEPVDSLLLDFLKEQKAADLIGTVHRIAERQLEFEGTMNARCAECRGDIRGLSLRVGALEKNDERLERHAEQSGSWDREALLAQVADKKDDLNWWRRNWIMLVISVLAVATSIASAVRGGK